MKRILLVCLSLTGAYLAAVFLEPRQLRGSSFAAPPRSIQICWAHDYACGGLQDAAKTPGAHDYACNTYVISYQPASHARRDSQGEGVIDYERKTISIVWTADRFKNVETLEREVFHAALWERGIRDTDKWEVHDWLYVSDRIIASLFHDNPEFVNYVTSGY